MKVLVPVKRVIDPNVRPRVKADGSGVDLANAFVVWVADEKDGNADRASADEDYLWAAYKVALGREPDEGGALSNLTFIKDGGDRKTMLRSMLESQEFKNLP